jgi:serine phosphatase RsbU (regulator of sigma subunit)
MHVLIIDDEDGIRAVLNRKLSSLGYQVRTAENGLEGLRMAAECPPAILILDVTMPGMDGFGVLERLRSSEVGRRIHVLMLTAKSMVDEVERGLVAGADDYLTKPFDLRELVARVNAAARLQELQGRLRQANLDLARAKEELESTLAQRDMLIRKMSMELDMAVRLQQHLLPPVSCRSGRFLVSTLYRPTSRIGGDLFDIRSRDSGSLSLLLADAAGHGVSAALLAAMLKMALHEQPADAETPSRVLAGLNHRFQFCADLGVFVALFIGHLDTRSGNLVYCNAGLVPPLHYRSGSGRAIALDSPGFCLGVFEDGQYEDREVRLDAGDRLLVYTDGLSEASGAQMEDFGSRLPGLRMQGTELANEDFLDLISGQLRDHLGSAEPEDDYTLLSIQHLR